MKPSHLLITLAALTSPLLLCSAPTLAATHVAEHGPVSTIKVLLVRNAPSAFIEAKGRYEVFNPVDGLQLGSSSYGQKGTVSIGEQGIKWGELPPGIFQIRIVPGDSRSYVLINGVQYRGNLEIYAIDGMLNVINEIDIENFLKSSLSFQFPEKIPNDALEAIAIVERTHAYHLITKNPDAVWHADAKVSGYQGYALAFQNPHVDKALESTRNVVMKYHNAPFAAGWTKNSAGKTTDVATILRKNIPTPPGVSAPLAAKDRDKHGWSFLMNRTELATAAKLNNIASVDLYVDQNSGKVYAGRLSSDSEGKIFDYPTLQRMIGKKKLLSNDFTAKLKGDSIVFSGFGEGTGIGLCLYSAKLMAEQGDNAQKILLTFFPETKLENIHSPPSVEPIAEKPKPTKGKNR
jgi:SpoIID/LytB domain protein